MALRLSSSHLVESEDSFEDRDASSSSEDDDEETWDDWVSDSMDKRLCWSLFEDKVLPSVEDAIKYDKETHNIDLEQLCARLALDPHSRIRLVNWIRKEKPSPSQVAGLEGTEQFFSLDDYLIPVIEDDPLLQVPTGDWSDSDDDEAPSKTEKAPADLASATKYIRTLERKLQQAKQDLVDYRAFVSERLNLTSIAEALKEPSTSASASANVTEKPRDDDSHYFQSYGENDIHAVMIQDKVRTATYASFIQSNPEVFRDAIVMDVGCGTGILSLFAAQAGAKHVYAVDASDIAEKAEQIIKLNGLSDKITVIRGKVEDIKLPEGVEKVDVIVSEWMGYALLYESMLDSVLHARDRFLRPEGIMAPSQCSMMLGLCEAGEIFKERIGFWNDVYGFDLSPMAQNVYDDAIVDVVGPDTICSEPYTIKDIYVGTITPKQLSFTSPFKLISTVERRTKIHAFVLYFDTFFTSTGEPVPPDTEVHIVREGDPILAEIWPLGGRPHVSRRLSSGEPLKGNGRPKVTSFSTGPASEPTHWKQTLFLLREPITVSEGTIVQGTFKCRKTEGNSRELEVEIVYRVSNPEDSAPSENTSVVQIFTVR